MLTVMSLRMSMIMSNTIIHSPISLNICAWMLKLQNPRCISLCIKEVSEDLTMFEQPEQKIGVQIRDRKDILTY